MQRSPTHIAKTSPDKFAAAQIINEEPDVEIDTHQLDDMRDANCSGVTNCGRSPSISSLSALS